MQKASRMTKDEIALLFDLRDNRKWPVKQIAAELGRAPSSIHSTIRSRRIGRLGKYGRPKKADAVRNRAIAAYKVGASYAQITAKTGLSKRYLTELFAQERAAGRLQYRLAPVVPFDAIWTGARKIVATRYFTEDPSIAPRIVAFRLNRRFPGARVTEAHVLQFSEGLRA